MDRGDVGARNATYLVVGTIYWRRDQWACLSCGACLTRAAMDIDDDLKYSYSSKPRAVQTSRSNKAAGYAIQVKEDSGRGCGCELASPNRGLLTHSILAPFSTGSSCHRISCMTPASYAAACLLGCVFEWVYGDSSNTETMLTWECPSSHTTALAGASDGSSQRQRSKATRAEAPQEQRFREGESEEPI